MIYRPAELEEIVGDLMDAVEQERTASERLGAEAERLSAEAKRVHQENRRLRSTLCAILAATQQGNPSSPETREMMTEIESMVEEALERVVLAAGGAQ
jgi:methyl-accepting chemotaxis protein